MQTSNIISVQVSADLAGQEHKLVKMTSTGIALTTGVDPSAEHILGSIIHGNLPAAFGESVVGRAATVMLRATGLHFLVIGAGISTAIAVGDEVEMDTTDGTICKKTSATAIGVAFDSAPSSSAGGIIRVYLY